MTATVKHSRHHHRPRYSLHRSGWACVCGERVSLRLWRCPVCGLDAPEPPPAPRYSERLACAMSDAAWGGL